MILSDALKVLLSSMLLLLGSRELVAGPTDPAPNIEPIPETPAAHCGDQKVHLAICQLKRDLEICRDRVLEPCKIDCGRRQASLLSRSMPDWRSKRLVSRFSRDLNKVVRRYRDNDISGYCEKKR